MRLIGVNKNIHLAHAGAVDDRSRSPLPIISRPYHVPVSTQLHPSAIMSNEKPPTRTGLSLYANLLDPSKNAPGTISSAPVSYNKPSESSPEDEAAKKQQPLAGK